MRRRTFVRIQLVFASLDVDSRGRERLAELASGEAM
jgi:hypothetical protein